MVASARMGLRKQQAPSVTYTTLAVGPAADAALGGGASADTRISQEFTPTATSTIRHLTFTFWTAPTAGTFRLGVSLTSQQIATNLNPTTWVAFADAVNPGGGDITVDLGDTVLTGGTSYVFSIIAETGQRLETLGYKFSAASPTGGTSSGLQQFDGTSSFNSSALHVPFTAGA